MPLLSENHVLKIVDKYFVNKHSSLILGRGDDCAVLGVNQNLCFSSDLFIEDIHFRHDYFQAGDIGYKALAVNISDIAAMGANPLGFSLCLGLSPKVDEKWLNEFFNGMSSLAHEHNMVLVGGDIARSNQISVCISIWGESAKSPLKANKEDQSTFLVRGGAMPGDTLFLVGHVGLARVGLSVLEAHGIKASDDWPVACATHLRPKPLVRAGLSIARLGLQARPPVLMDLSDGLAKDLPRLLGGDSSLQSHLGAQVVLPESLLHEEVVRYNRTYGLCPSVEAWLGGEDYALLGACAPKLFPIIYAALPLAYGIGCITDDGAISLNAQDIPTQGGFDHFA